MRDTCHACDFFLERGLASASSPPSETSDMSIGRGICRRRSPVVVPDPDLPLEQRSQFPIVDNAHWCGDFRSGAWTSPC